jgi:hypothetical protein
MKKSEVSHDQFFTNKSTALYCLELVSKHVNKVDLFIEPSAGTGNFYKNLPVNKRLGIDIVKQSPDIIESDFLIWDLPAKYLNKDICFVGNPPFGRNSNLAVKFFNHAAKIGNCICFILPRTFRKDMIINRLDRYYHLKHQELLPEAIFELKDGTGYSVPTVFQIWTKKSFKRKIIKRKSIHNDWEWVHQDNANMSIRRVGVNAGKIFNHSNVNVNSHYFIKSKNKNVLYDRFDKIFEKIWDPKKCNINSSKYDTAGNPSLNKSDIVREYIKKYGV